MVDPPVQDDATIPRDPIPRDNPPSTSDARVNPGDGVLVALPFDERYEVRRELGRGGMGVVTLRHDQQIGRDVALKQLHPKYRDHPSLGQRFLHEARIQAQLEHPAVVPVYSLAPTPEGPAYFTMKRVRGQTLGAVIDQLRTDPHAAMERQSRRKLLSDFSRLCQAVDFAHRRGVLHRDIKPSNIMVGEYGEVYLLDWGVAALTSAESRGPDQLPATASETASPIGTPGYAAPEQWLDPENIDVRADVYSLGCVLFEVLTLERLHRGSDRSARIASTMEREPPAPSERAPSREIPPELDVICMRAIARHPGRRYATAKALHQAIERILDGERDLELRRSLAREHAEHARQAAREASEAVEGDRVESRREALREVGRALALDPGNASAMKTMLRLLTRPPERVPPDVDQRLAHAAAQRLRAAGRIAALLYLGLLLYLPFIWWAGIVDGRAVVAILGLGTVAGLISLYCSVAKRLGQPLVLVAMVTSMAAMAGSAALYGPLVLTPGIVAVNCTAYAITVGTRQRRITLVVGLLAVLVPLGLELSGVLSPSYQLSSAGMTIIPRALALDGTPALVLLTIASLGTIVTGTFAVGRVRDALDRAERRLEVYNWHFQQLLPEHADAAASPREG